MKWHNLWLVWLVLPVAGALYLAWRDRLARPGVAFAHLAPAAAAPRTWAVRLRHLPLGLRSLALALLFLAVLRPQVLMGEEEIKLRGVNIMLVTDLSGSMVAEDLKPDRLTAEKKVMQDFVTRAPQDQVGLVVFGAKSFTQSPLTMDHEVLANAIRDVDMNTVDSDGTAVGDGIITAVNRLSKMANQTNIIVLATDGVSNKGEDPRRAAEIAAAKRIRIYTIGLGAKGGAPIYVKDQFGAKQAYMENGRVRNWEEPDEATMKDISSKTGGDYFRATDEKSLEAVYARISKLIKDEKKRRDPHYRDLFGLFLALAAGALVLETLLSATWLRSLT